MACGRCVFREIVHAACMHFCFCTWCLWWRSVDGGLVLLRLYLGCFLACLLAVSWFFLLSFCGVDTDTIRKSYWISVARRFCPLRIGSMRSGGRNGAVLLLFASVMGSDLRLACLCLLALGWVGLYYR